MVRPVLLALGLTALSIPAVAAPQAAAPRRSAAVSEAIVEVLEQSQKSGRGVLVYVGGQAVGGAVVKVGEQVVELKSREYGRIVLRLERIDGVAGN